MRLELQQVTQTKRARLQDEAFRAKAPAEVIAQEEEGLQALEAELANWSASLASRCQGDTNLC